jgi:hypothetical protein
MIQKYRDSIFIIDHKKITKVNLEKMSQVEQMHFLLSLFFFAKSSSELCMKTQIFEYLYDLF